MNERIIELLVNTIDYIYDEYCDDSQTLIKALRYIGYTWEEAVWLAAWVEPEVIKEVYND